MVHALKSSCYLLVTLGLFHFAVASDLLDDQITMNEGYSIHMRPPTKDGKPVLVEASINIRNILDIDEKAMLVSMETTLRLFWKDTRIKPNLDHIDSKDARGNYTVLNTNMAQRIWMPDIFIDQAKSLRTPTYFTKPASLRVYTDSTIRYSSRINFDFACNMDFRRYPVDEQICDIKFESFGMQANQVHLKWIPNSIHVNPNITLAQFAFSVKDVVSYETEYYDLRYPGLILQLHLSRQIMYHVVQTYIPSTVFVLLAWMSTFVPPDCIPGRIGMSMTNLLTQTAMFSSVRGNVPKVSYVSFLDIWMLVCQLFSFSVIVESITVISLLKTKKALLMKTSFSSIKQMSVLSIEKCCHWTLPIVFLSTNIVYWSIIMEHYNVEDSVEAPETMNMLASIFVGIIILLCVFSLTVIYCNKRKRDRYHHVRAKEARQAGVQPPKVSVTKTIP